MSSSPVISVEKLGKRCRIGLAAKRPKNLREALQRLPPASYLFAED